MQSLLSYISFLILTAACNSTTASVQKNNAVFHIDLPNAIKTVIEKDIEPEDTIVPAPLKAYSDIEYEKKELLSAAPGTKSVLFNNNGSKLYAMNLEGMSIYEFDQPTRKVIRNFRFKPTKGLGWDYANDKPISSYQEKPVEACLSHDDKILWVSLHNAEGIVPIRVDSMNANRSSAKNKKAKKIRVIYPGISKKDSFYTPLIKTGKTPKIISRTADSKYLLVSNWHSYTVSVLETNIHEYPFAKVISTIPVSDIPRGIVVDDNNNRSFVAIMGGSSITVINNTVWMKEDDIKVESNPRHIVMDTSDHIFVSYNKLAKIACLDAATGKTLFTASTAAQPRTIILSKNHRFLFVTCYSSDIVEVFKITDTGFTKVISLRCKGHPVGVDIFEDDNKLEAWVCSYSNGSISVFSFKKR